MSDKKKEYEVVIGIFDTITKDIRKSVLENSKESKILGVGVYTDEYCESTFFSSPLKSTEHRMQIAQGLTGVRFTFPVNTSNPKEIEKLADEAYNDYINEIKLLDGIKKYKAGFVIGSFDLFHAGHLQNITLASEMCQDLYVVIKTDERIFDRKKKQPVQNTTERAAVVGALKPVRGVLYYDLDSTREDVIKSVIEQYEIDYPGEILEPKDMVAIFGEDLQDKEEQRKREGDWGEVNVEFTPRSAEKMEKISSTAYKKEMESHGGLKGYEDREAEGLVDSNSLHNKDDSDDGEHTK